jgi:hypothetical protein
MWVKILIFSKIYSVFRGKKAKITLIVFKKLKPFLRIQPQSQS